MGNSTNELRDKILGLVPQSMCQFGCDGNGTYAEQDIDGQPYPAQCEYCYLVRFPTVDALYRLVVESNLESRIDELGAGLNPETMTAYTSNNGIGSKQLNVHERIKELQSQLSSIGGKTE